MNEDTELVYALTKVSDLLKGMCDRLNMLHDATHELALACQAMNRHQIKQQAAIINTHNMLCDLVAPKND